MTLSKINYMVIVEYLKKISIYNIIAKKGMKLKMKVISIKIIIRYCINYNSNSIINNCIFFSSRYTKQNTKRNRRKL